MKKASGQQRYTYVWISLVILVFGIIFVPKIVARLTTGSTVEQDRSPLAVASEPLSYIRMNGENRKVPSFAFYNQDSLLVSDKDYLGKVYVVEFFFTSCPTICPVMNQNLVGMQEQLKDFPDFGVAAFTIDPEHDTPQVLKQYAEAHGITDIDWNLMTGDLEDIYALANDGFNIFASVAPDVPGGFEHSGLFALVDKKGYLRSRVDAFGNPIIYYRGAILEDEAVNDHGEEQQISILVADIKKLLAE